MGVERKGFWAVVRRELRRAVSRPIYVLVALIFPAIAFTIVICLFQQTVPRDLPIAVCDMDQSALSRRVVRWADATPSLRVAYRVNDSGEGEALVNAGRAYALVLLPQGLQRNVYRGHAPKVSVYYNNQYMLTGALVQRDLTMALSTLSAGINITVREKRGEMRDTAYNHVLPIQVDNHMLFNPYFSYAYYLLPPLMACLLQVFIMITTVFVLGIELREETADAWLACAGGNVWKAVCAKMFPYTCIFVLFTWGMIALLLRYMDMPVRGDVRMIAAGGILFVLAYESMGLFFIAITSNLRYGMSFGALYVSPAFAFSGITFPPMGMPLFGKMWSSLLPVSHYLTLFMDQSMRGAPDYVSWPTLGILGLFAGFAPVFLLPRMKHLMTHEHHWGRI